MRFTVERPDVCDRHAELKRRQNLFGDDSLLRFCIAYVAPDSPCAEERDFDIRMQSAFEYITLPPKEEDRIRALVDKDDATYREYIYELFRFLNDIDYELWFTLKSSYHIMTARLRSPSSMLDSDRRHLQQALSGTAYELKQVEFRLFKEDHLKKVVQEEAAANSLGGFAEKFALPSPD